MGGLLRLAGATLVASTGGLGGAAAAQTPPARIYGSTEDLRFLATVEAKLEARMQASDAPRAANGKTTIEFAIAGDGRVATSHIVSRSDPKLDAFAARALATAAPFPAPPAHFRAWRLVWTTGVKPDGSRLIIKPPG